MPRSELVALSATAGAFVRCMDAIAQASPDRTNGRAYATVLCLLSVCRLCRNRMYCG